MMVVGFNLLCVGKFGVGFGMVGARVDLPDMIGFWLLGRGSRQGWPRDACELLVVIGWWWAYMLSRQRPARARPKIHTAVQKVRQANTTRV